ncbi:hypothetical protein AT959_05690 [Dechloromonas denitrificans]|uniref:Uncharacterized protein n=1 Tax=Dechloromonas denitrificans TaxID=281362 RepID=A0A133XLM6_9RHOO|nr:hypothetical protein [Dechloromonas denitrificans]KXB31835.1 hypothetical protein AT959_05690 [Dechloromonas denitrificans]
MSILRDLDPTNTRLSALQTPRSGKAIVWISALLLIIAGTAWLFLAQYRERKNGAIESQQNEKTHRGNPPGTLELAQRVPGAALLLAEHSHPPIPDKGAALIRESPPAQENAKERNNSSLDISQERNTGLKAEQPSYKNELVVAPQNKSKENRPLNSAATKKQGKALAAHTATDGSRSLATTKKPAERDIDIITAIVR